MTKDDEVLSPTEEKRRILRAMVRGIYDLQKLRIAAGLRLCANFRAKLKKLGVIDIPDGKDPDEELEKKAKKIIDLLKASYRKLTEGVAKNRNLPAREGFVGDELISDFAELELIDQYLSLERAEDRASRQLPDILDGFRIYNEFLRDITGIGPTMAAVIIAEYDIHKARYPSSLWAYAGLDVAADGLGRSRRKEHLVTRQYVDKKGKPAERQGVTFNPFLKTKLTGVLGTSFLRTGSEYRKIYDSYKHRLETDPRRQGWKEKVEADPESFVTDNWRPRRIHDAAIRYMVKAFLVDLYKAWRAIEGLPVAPSYAEKKLGIYHRSDGPESKAA